LFLALFEFYSDMLCCVEGVYPDCRLCGTCYDSVARRIDDVASDVQQSYDAVIDVWSRLYRQYSTPL